MMEISILAGMLTNKEVYDQFERFGDREDLSAFGKLIYSAVGEYFAHDPSVQRCDRAIITERVLRGLSNPKHQTAFREFIDGIPSDVSATNVAYEIAELRRERIGQSLSLTLANRGSRESIDRLIDDYRNSAIGYSNNERTDEAELVDVLATDDLERPAEDAEKKIKLFPKALNDRLDGGARPGHHVLVYGRPEMGKTAVTINLCAGFLKQGLNVLYVGNEEPAEDIRDRIRCRLLKITKGELNADRLRASQALSNAGLATLKVAALHPGSPQQISRILDSGSYQVLVIDQLRNLQVKADTKVGELETAAKAARELAKKFHVLAVSITQAGDSATGKVYLDMNDVDSSKTGIPAAVDLMIGVGADESMKANGLLGLSLPKNKLSGSHDKFTVSVDFSKSFIL